MTYRGGAVYAEGRWMSGVHQFLDRCVLPLGFTQSRLYDQRIPHSLNADWNQCERNARERACNVTEAGRMRLGREVHAALKRFIDRRRAQSDRQPWFSVATALQIHSKRRPATAVCNALRTLENHCLCPIAAEVEVYWWPVQLGTRIDLVCIDKLTNALVPVELKTRRSPQAAMYARCQGRTLRYPFSAHDANLANLHFVQTMIGQILLEKTIQRVFLAAPSDCDSHTVIASSKTHVHPITALRQILACVYGHVRMPKINPAAVLYVGSADTQAVLQFVPCSMLEQKSQLELLMSRSQGSSLGFTSLLSTTPQRSFSKPPRPFGSASVYLKRLPKRAAPSKRPGKAKAKRKRVKLRHN